MRETGDRGSGGAEAGAAPTDGGRSTLGAARPGETVLGRVDANAWDRAEVLEIETPKGRGASRPTRTAGSGACQPVKPPSPPHSEPRCQPPYQSRGHSRTRWATRGRWAPRWSFDSGHVHAAPTCGSSGSPRGWGSPDVLTRAAPSALARFAHRTAAGPSTSQRPLRLPPAARRQACSRRRSSLRDRRTRRAARRCCETSGRPSTGRSRRWGPPP